MHTILLKKAGIFTLMVSFLFSTFPAASYAGLVGTDEMLAAETRDRQMTELQGLLARDEVRTQLLEFGVDPLHVEERLNALSDAELARLSDGIGELPAGGDVIEVIGIVFLVILILELLGVTNVFTKI